MINADWLAGQVAELTGRAAATVDPDRTFAENGLDSARLARLAERISERLGRVIDPAVLFDHPSVARLVEFLPHSQAATPDDAPVAEAGVPVAVVGLACRMPGAADADAFWRLLITGTEAVREAGADRWQSSLQDDDPSTPGRVITNRAGFLDDIVAFDATFFRIPDVEASRMDPQQRLLLETSWDALEDAGEPPATLRGSQTGVFVGIATSDYAFRQLADREGIGAHTATGSSLAIAANRLSYIYDWHGPSMAVDTACSSSLVAVHLAVRALRAGDCERALVGGVNALVEPELSVGLTKAGMLASDGRCKPFDAGANGYVRGEGCGVVVLKRLSAALAAGDRIYAVIRGTAINSDGASNGMTAPNPAAQRAVLRTAYADAGLSPADASYVECHGTGTALGDPIEAGALAHARGPDARPCMIGSVKGNIGHLEAAAGIAGLIKTVLSIHHGQLAPSMHFTVPNPRIAFDELRLRVVTAPTDWPSDARRAGVSSFGFGGTNAHVVLEGLPAAPEQPAVDRPLVVPLSARGLPQLSSVIRAVADRVASAPDSEVAAIAATLARRRTHHRPYRLAVVAPGPRELADRLATLASGTLPRISEVPPDEPRIAYVFSGQGAQWAGMGAELLDDEPLFQSVIRRCDEAVAGELPFSVESALSGTSQVDLDDTAVAQPLIVAVQLGLTEVLRSRGITPSAVVGHSVGEITAAVVSGALDLTDGMRLAVLRGRVMADAGGKGGMLVVGLDERQAIRYCAASDEVELAAVNAPESVVLAGPVRALDTLAARLAAEGVPVSRLPVRYAFHCSMMDEAARRLAEACRELTADGTEIPLYSTVSGALVAGAELDVDHWVRGVRNPVRFADAVTAMLGDGVDIMLEVGSKPVLRGMLRRIASARPGAAPPVLCCVGHGPGQQIQLAHTVGEMYGLGVSIRWSKLYPDRVGVASVPPHPWIRERYWLNRPQAGAIHPGADRLLGARLDAHVPTGTAIWMSDVDTRALPSLADHRVVDRPVFPAAGYAELFRRAAAELGQAPVTLTDLHFTRALELAEQRRLQVSLVPSERGWSARAHVRQDSWQELASGELRAAGPPPAAADVDAIRARCPGTLPGAALYAMLREHGLDYGPAFRAVTRAWTSEAEAISELELPDAGDAHLRMLDAALHVIGALAGSSAGIAVPVEMADQTWWGNPAEVRYAHTKVLESTADSMVAEVHLLGADGSVHGRIGGLRVRRVGWPGRTELAELHRYRTVWRARPAAACPAGIPAGRWLVLAPAAGPGNRIGRELADHAGAVLAESSGALRLDGDGPHGIDACDVEHHHRLIAHVSARGPLDGIVHLLGCAGSPADIDATAAPAVSAVNLIRAISFGGHGRLPKIVFATNGAQPVAGTAPRDPFGATVWGLAKTVPIEHPMLDHVCVDLDPDDADPAGSLLAELATAGPDAEVGLRGGVRHVRRIVPDTDRLVPPLALDPGAAYVVTGGTGALGIQVAAQLAAQGARHLALIARGEKTLAPRDLAALRGNGATVTVHTADIADAAALAAVLDRVRADGTPIRGVVHAAGVLDNAALLDLTPANTHRVFAAKVFGGWNLHRLTRADDLDMFVAFSSAAGVLGSPGQANYAAANAFLDALVHHRRGLGLPGVSVDWGPWAEAGMAANWDTDHELRTAASAIPPEVGRAAFASLAAGEAAQPVVLPFDLRDLVQFYPSGNGRSFLEEITNADVEALRSIGTRSAARPDLDRPYVAPRSDVERRIAAIWQKAMGVEPIGVLDSIFQLGGDSVLANQILIEVNRALGVSLSPEGAFGEFTVANLAVLAEAAMTRMLDELTDEEALRLLDVRERGQEAM